MKKILIAVFLLFASVSFSQTFTLNSFTNDDGVNFGTYIAEVDSQATYTSNWVSGLSLIDGQTITMTHLFGAGTGGGTITNDSILVVIQCRSRLNSTTWLIAEADTQLVIGRSGSIGLGVALSLTNRGEEYRVIVRPATQHASTHSESNRTMSLTFTSPTLDRPNAARRLYGNTP